MIFLNLRANRIMAKKAGNPKWQPGISGNPGGRSSELAAQQSAAKFKAAGLADEALDFLVKTLGNEEEATPYRLRAATEILDRALGRPAQAIDIEFITKQRLMTELSLDELTLLEERLAAVSPPPPLLVNGTRKS
jgi:hypothetical protein